ncbi:hypothetical protein, partial [Actinocorallia lasiicapitis]
MSLLELPPRGRLVHDLRERLAGHLAGLVTAEGAVPGHCRGRVLETALTLRLIALTGERDGDAVAL